MKLKNKEIIDSMSLLEKADFLSGKNYWETLDFPKHFIGSMFLSDGPNGLRKQIKSPDAVGLNPSLPATCFPSSSTTACSWNVDLLENIGHAIGEEAVSQKVNVLLAPGVNIKRNPLCGRNFEYFSEDPILTGYLASAFIRGVQSNGIAACVKHFACNNQETRRMSIDTIVDERTLREIYLTAFEMAVKDGGVKCVMSAYNRLNGDYCNENIHLQKGILRGDWGFDGVVLTDWGAENDRVKGLIAGNSLEMPSTSGETSRDIVAAVRCGLIDKDDLDLAVDRLLTLVKDTESVYRHKRKPFNVAAHNELAQKAAEESIVLLKNEANTLPFKKEDRVAVIGDFAKNPRYQGAGSAIVNPTQLDSFLSEFQKTGYSYLGYEKGYDRYGKGDPAMLHRAVKLAQQADKVIVFLGLDEVTEGEGFDRTNLKIPQNQITLLNCVMAVANKVIIVLVGGSVVEIPYTDRADAIVNVFLAGQAGGKALTNILIGQVNPSGKLAETYPISYSDTPSSRHFADNEKTVEYREGIYVGYRYFETARLPVRYPFGYGLSYTKFAYSNLTVDNLGAYFVLTNTGKMAGSEIAELYVSKKDSSLFRPALELKGFRKIFLEPGASRRVNIFFDDKTFRYFNVLTNSWEIEPGEYQIKIGANCEDIRLETTYSERGTSAPSPYDPTQLPSYFSGRVTDVSAPEFEELLHRSLPSPNQTFDQKDKRHITVDYTTIVADLRYCKGFFGRFVARGVRQWLWLLRHLGKRQAANTLQFGVYYQPLRSMSRMSLGKVSWKQLNALIEMFNGHFFRGLHHYVKEGRHRRVLERAERITIENDEAKMAEIAASRELYVDMAKRENEEKIKRSRSSHDA
jgi:beta-glucosidase